MKPVLFLIGILAVMAAACNLGAPRPVTPTDIFSSPTPPPPTLEPVLPPTAEVLLTGTSEPEQVQPTAAPTRRPQSQNPTPPPTLTPGGARPTPRPPAPNPQPGGDAMFLQMYLVALEDGGASGEKVGCNDSLVPVTIEVPRTQGVLRAALSKLLALKKKDYGESGLYNALYQSDLSIQSLAVTDGEAVIRLSGQLASGGVCDDPRIIGQIEATARQFSTVDRVSVYINGKAIRELLSGK